MAALRREDALCRLKGNVGVNRIANRLRRFPSPSLVDNTTDLKQWSFSHLS